MHIITVEQMRGCRAILGWSFDELSAITGISTSTLKRIEKGSGRLQCRVEHIEKIINAFEGSGLVQLPDATTIVIVDSRG